MILTEKVNVKIIGKTLNYFRNLGYDVNVKDIIEIPIEHLNRKSRIKINVKCDICGLEKELSYQKYTKNTDTYNYYTCSQKCSIDKCKSTFIKKYGESSPMKIDEIKNKGILIKNKKYGNLNNISKIKLTNLLKYGVEYSLQDSNIRNKIKETCMKKYGSVSYMGTIEFVEKTKISKIIKGINLPDELLVEFKLYKRNVTKITRRNIKELYEKWDGLDYYDNEFIKNNFLLNPMNRKYPTIDHKVSTFNGFIDNIDCNIIGGLDNLCITKKYLNSIKGKNTKCENFINKDLFH